MAGDMESNNQFESIPQIQSSFLSSFLDDSNVEFCCDDERLRVVIQSLEAAINPMLMNDQANSNINDDDDEQISSFSESSAPPEDVLDFISWMEAEMLSPCCSSSNSSDVDVDDDDELSWYGKVSGDDELDLSHMIEYGAAVSGGDYSSEIPMEMDMDMDMEMVMVMDEHIYSSLCQENYDLQSCTSQY